MGRPPWSQAGTQGGGQTIAVNDRPELDQVEVRQTSTLGSDSTATTEIYAPEGSVYRILAMRILAPAPSGAGSGDHYIKLNTLGEVGVLFGSIGYDTDLWFTNSQWQNTMDEDYPNGAGETLEALQSLTATDDSPVSIVYRNRTDVDQTQTREVDLVVEEVTY